MTPEFRNGRRGRVIALLGAESTGKSTLAAELRAALASPGCSVTCVDEFLREFCDRQGRTPRREEQAAIAAEQTRRIEHAAVEHDLVITDTTALMIAVYSDLVFGDPTLYAQALQDQASYDLHLLTAIDLPWQADRHQRDGPHAREPADERLRKALMQGGLPFSVICGSGPSRLANALASARAALRAGHQIAQEAPSPRWQWFCERCGDPGCERHRLGR